MQKCKKNNRAVFTCSSQKCQLDAFICAKLQCCQQNLHKDCILISLDKISQLKEESKQNFQKYTSQICSFYQKIIKKINFDYIGFKSWAKQHLEKQKVFQTRCKNQNEINGDFMSRLVDVWNVFSDDQWGSISHEITEVQNSIQKWINTIKKIYSKTQVRISQQRNSRNILNFQINSSILWQDNDIKSLGKILSSTQMKIEQLKCLYKASDHNFSIQKFHSLCDGIPNTIVLLKTSNNKIVGGFTPLAWQSPSFETYKEDRNKKSFVFSIDTCQKFLLTQPQFAIQCNTNCGPMFGRGAAIWIYDNANQNGAYWHILPTSYKPKQNQWTQQSFTNFIGSKMYQKFTINQWQVFQVIFE